jgi:HD-GYP domain-containing protein (c-di-GMP phosphodiesterase class II)
VQLERQLVRLESLRTIDEAIASSFDLGITLKVLLDQVTTQLKVDAADVLLLNPRSQMLEHAGARGFRTEALKHTHLRLGEGYAGQAALKRLPIRIPVLNQMPDGLKRSPLLRAEDFAAYFSIPLIAKGRVLGVLEIFHRSPLDPDREWEEFLQTLAAEAALAIDNAGLFSDLQRSNLDLSLAYDATIEGWSRAMDLRDKETEGHTQRVTGITERVALALGMGGDILLHMRRGALLHDIGKMGIPDAILLKPGPLTDEEWDIMRKHPTYALEMLSPITYLRPALDIPYCHHEKWDGTGYPRGMKGEEIPLPARAFAIVDVWDALRSDRPYRSAWPAERVLQYVAEQSGKHFDPRVVETFLRVLKEIGEDRIF